MELKRLYNHDAPTEQWVNRVSACQACGGRGVVVNAAGTGVTPCTAAAPTRWTVDEGRCVQGKITEKVPPVVGVKVLSAPARHHFSTGLVQQGITQGWISLGRGQIVVHGEAGAVVYRIERGPGFYCCHCQLALDDGPSGRAHVAAAHAGVPSPDLNNPAGYEQIHYYDCAKMEG